MAYQKDDEKYLVTGAGGQLGYALQLAMGGDEGNAMPRSREAFDITNVEHTLEWLPQMHPNAVVNCAAYTDVAQAEREREECWRINVLGVEHLCQACSENEIPLFHISSDFVFGQDFTRTSHLRQYEVGTSTEQIARVESEICYQEYDPVGPLGCYAQSKVSAEHVILRHAAENPDFQYFIIRTGGLFERPWRLKRNFPYNISRALLKRSVRELPIVRDVFTNITYADHLATALMWMVQNRDTITVEEGILVPVGIYHITNKGMATWYEVAQRLSKYIGGMEKLRPTTREKYAEGAGRDPKLLPTFTCLCQTRYESTHGPEMPSWQEAVRDWARQAGPYFKREDTDGNLGPK